MMADEKIYPVHPLFDKARTQLFEEGRGTASEAILQRILSIGGASQETLDALAYAQARGDIGKQAIEEIYVALARPRG